MTRAERLRWIAARDRYEDPRIEAARAKGRVPVIDCTARDYPLPPHVIAELRRVTSPEYRDAAMREAADLTRRAVSWRSLAGALDTRGKPGNAEALRAKADEAERRAKELAEEVRP